MKHLLITLSALVAFIFSANTTLAQQAKAYETIHYAAKAGALMFKLDYADGYLAASKINITQGKQKPQVLVCESAVPESNGDLRFISDGADKQPVVILADISEEVIAPKTLRATYIADGQKIPLQFTRTRK